MGTNETNTVGNPPAGGSVQIGTVVAYLGKTAPDTWLICNGDPIPAQYGQLISMIGPNTPNLCGRTLIGVGTGTDSNNNPRAFGLNETGGEYTNTLTIETIPSHTHTISYSFWGTSSGGGSGDTTNLRNSNESKDTGATGGGQPHNNVQPYYVVNYIIYAGTN